MCATDGIGFGYDCQTGGWLKWDENLDKPLGEPTGPATALPISKCVEQSTRSMLDERVKRVVVPVVYSCHKKARMLRKRGHVLNLFGCLNYRPVSFATRIILLR